MRSCYSAFARHRHDYLLDSWHPRTRPAQMYLDPEHTWLGLEVVSVTGGGAGDSTGTAHFRARARSRDGRTSTLDENSRFERVRGVWKRVDGQVLP